METETSCIFSYIYERLHSLYKFPYGKDTPAWYDIHPRLHENDKYHKCKLLSQLYCDDSLLSDFSDNYNMHLDRDQTFFRAILVQSAYGDFG